MKNITFTYDSWMDGEQGEACMTVMVDDEHHGTVLITEGAHFVIDE